MTSGWLTLSCALACSFFSGRQKDVFTEKYGLGIVNINENSSAFFVLHLYARAAEGQPNSRVIELRWMDDGRIVDEFHAAWKKLLPFPISGGGSPFLVCMETQGDWYRVRLGDDKDYWIRQEDRAYEYGGEVHVYKKLELVTWGAFAASKAWADRKDPSSNPIRMRPSVKAGIVQYEYGDCLRPFDVKGWWIAVRPENGEGCISDSLDGVPMGLFERGWVQWRNDSAFLVLTSPYWMDRDAVP